MCQGCVDSGRITQKVLDATDAFSTRWPLSPFGPAHIVIDDGNVEDRHIQWCLDNWDTYAGDEPERTERAPEYEATKVFLRELLTWPIEDRIGSADLAERLTDAEA